MNNFILFLQIYFWNLLEIFQPRKSCILRKNDWLCWRTNSCSTWKIIQLQFLTKYLLLFNRSFDFYRLNFYRIYFNTNWRHNYFEYLLFNTFQPCLAWLNTQKVYLIVKFCFLITKLNFWPLIYAWKIFGYKNILQNICFTSWLHIDL